eukprot:Gb_03270 [translate_table: standard]
MESSSACGNEALTQQHKEYAAFEQKVKCTVYLDNLSPLVTVPILKTALGQFGTVVDAQVCPNYQDPKNVSAGALVEMQSEREASSTVTEISANPFMIAGMPRPARARRAEAEMFTERPALPGRRIQCYWVNSGDPDWEDALQLKQRAKRHAAETSYLLKFQREEEEKLGDQQELSFRTIYKKYEIIDGIYADGTAERLRGRYNLQ